MPFAAFFKTHLDGGEPTKRTEGIVPGIFFKAIGTYLHDKLPEK
jgi:hypothetical protein